MFTTEKGKILEVIQEGDYRGKQGKITAVADKKGFQKSYEYVVIELEFEDGSKSVFKPWELFDPNEPKDETEIKPPKKRRKKKA